ncbi:MAG: UvrB/UvrC motif-containing protein [Planctomycetes bacterium]|nr:UvrB/UvrC motif-containing protein [Planctomycetota bacterium]
MKCQQCHQREARVHLTEIKNGQKQELDLCEECASHMGLVGTLAETTVPEAENTTCPICGISLKDFVAAGRLGCENCYAAFRDHLGSIFLKNHSASTHKGKNPARMNAPERTRRMLQYLHLELDRAVAREDFEKAASLRDRITELETPDAAGR